MVRPTDYPTAAPANDDDGSADDDAEAKVLRGPTGWPGELTQDDGNEDDIKRLTDYPTAAPADDDGSATSTSAWASDSHKWGVWGEHGGEQQLNVAADAGASSRNGKHRVTLEAAQFLEFDSVKAFLDAEGVSFDQLTASERQQYLPSRWISGMEGGGGPSRAGPGRGERTVADTVPSHPNHLTSPQRDGLP